ncbi:hypothetical protein [Winogradskyella flava]|uniref:hypothetical protein n=1 Tax=Winogradskyella flava TaxID=1884876 RepID=UPI002491B5F9|nr:hypothetical protein [Winogradskyella flava]
MRKHIATYQIHDTFIITGRGIVFVGIILDGTIFLIGDFIEFEFNEQVLERKIKGIDNEMRVELGKPKVGVMIETKNENEIWDLRNWEPNKVIAKIFRLDE